MRIILGIALAFCLFNCSFPCEDQVVLSRVSPDQKFLARWIVRDCGATTNYASHVTLSRTLGPRWFSEERVLVIEGQGPIELSWHDAQTLDVAYPHQRTFTKETHYSNLQVNHLALLENKSQEDRARVPDS